MNTENPKSDGSPLTTDEINDQFDELFELASHGTVSGVRSATPEEQEKVEGISQVLGVVRAERAVTAADLEAVENRFLQLLSQEEPEHPWVSSAQQGTAAEEEEVEVKTLGDMVRLAAQSALPEIPPEVWAFLSQNTTALSDVTEVTRRSGLLGPIFKEASVPTAQIPTMYRWVSGNLASLTPGQNGVFVARRQRKRKSPPKQ